MGGGKGEKKSTKQDETRPEADMVDLRSALLVAQLRAKLRQGLGHIQSLL